MSNSSNQTINPAAYWRHSQEWSKWLGRTGVVIVATQVRVAAPQQEILTPYSLAVIDFGEEKHEFMGAGHEVLQAGDTVECVLRKLSVGDVAGLIEYGIKVKKVRA